ncbi:MAG: chitobiase/beta-hexosaminidase C-terminal domain-containing protein, partial [Verrucomicrobiales bacterium]
GGWSLSDDPDVPGKWQFPAATMIDAGGYLVVLADNPDAPIPGAHYLHANFKLSGGGDFLGLYDTTGASLDSFSPSFPRQFPFHSYGLAPDGASFGYFALPTPGGENAGPIFSDKVDAPDFDVEGGFYDSSVTVTLTSHTPGAAIRYTADGTEPTLSTGSAYETPLSLDRISNKKGHVIRARAFLDGMIPSNTKTNTYLIGQDARLRTAPALVYSADLPRSLYDPYGVLAIEGGSYPSNNWRPNDKDDYNNVFFRGRAYERPIHAEYYFADGSSGFRTNCGVRVAASSYSRPRMTLTSVNSSPWPSSPTQKPSFNLFFRNEYGNPDVSLPLNGENAPVKSFEQFRVRAGKNDIQNPFIIDELVRRMSRDMGQVASTGVINSLYVNGELKGFYNLVERLRTPFFRSYHSADPDADWDVLQYEGNDNIADGDKVAWDELISRLNAPANLANWEAVLEYADPESIADYFLLNIYMATWDWPHNNWVAARERSTEGRYRLYIWDAEGAMDNRGGRSVSTNMINSYIIGTQNGSGSSGRSGELRDLWNGLNRWEEFRILFADRINKHLFNGGVLDDRDFDNSHLKSVNDQLVEEFDDLLSFVSGQNVNNSHARNWATGTTRRDYLFGPNRESFRDHELWPVVTPPELSQFGGDVSAGYALNITNEIGDIYYTTDGSDPRLPGGEPNPNATAQGGSTLERELIAAGANWQFNDQGEDLGTAWREPGFDDQTWPEGAAPLGYGRITGFDDLTPMNTDRNPTAYLRRTFEIDDAPAYTSLSLSVHVDGGAVIYINGEEAIRDGMPAGP